MKHIICYTESTKKARNARKSNVVNKTMRRKILLIAPIILVIQGSFSIKKSFAQWEPDVRLTNDPDISYPSYNNARNIVANGDTVHVVWHSDQAGNGYDVYFKRSADGGETWEPDVRLTDDPASSAFPFIAGTDSALHVIWQDFRDGNPEIYYKRFLVENPGTGIRSIATNRSKAFSLGQNHPNPCSSLTRIKFHVPDAGNVNINLYDMFGKEAATLFNEKLLPGTYEITFDASGLTHGIWYYCLRTGHSAETKKLIQR